MPKCAFVSKMLYADIQVEAFSQRYWSAHVSTLWPSRAASLKDDVFWQEESTLLMIACLVFWRFHGEEYWSCCLFHSMVSEVQSVRWLPLCMMQKELLSYQKENIKWLFAQPNSPALERKWWVNWALKKEPKWDSACVMQCSPGHCCVKMASLPCLISVE